MYVRRPGVEIYEQIEAAVIDSETRGNVEPRGECFATRRVEMKAIRGVFAGVLLLAFLSSCSIFSHLQITPDYNAGRKAGESYAAEDGLEIKCGWPLEPTHMDAAIKARTYDGLLEEQGRSEAFIHGFYYGYQEEYEKRIGTYCGR